MLDLIAIKSWFAKFDKEKRPCPVCEHGMVVVKELHKGAECAYCHKSIELNFWFVVGIPSMFALLLTLFYKYDFAVLGHLCVALCGVFTAGYENVFAGYLPIKHYGDD